MGHGLLAEDAATQAIPPRLFVAEVIRITDQLAESM
jgi:hypothetical protein